MTLRCFLIESADPLTQTQLSPKNEWVTSLADCVANRF